MKLLILLFILFCSSSLTANAQNSASQQDSEKFWIGKYEWYEYAGRTAGGTAIGIGHGIEVSRTHNGKLTATISQNGWQTANEILCDVQLKDNILTLTYRRDAQDVSSEFSAYKKGDILLKLKRVISGKRTKILTYWGKLGKNTNPLSGRVYFKKQ